MIGNVIFPEIVNLIEIRDFATLKSVLDDLLPQDIADLLSDIPTPNEQAVVFRLVPKDAATEIFEYLDTDIQLNLLKALGNEEVSAILNDMSADDRTTLLEEVPASVAKEILLKLSPDERKIAKTLLGYPEESIGRLMTPDYVAVRSDWTVSQVLDHLRDVGKKSETLDMIYVVNSKGILIDDIQIKEFLFAPLHSTVEELMDGNYIYLYVYDDQEKAVDTFQRYGLPAIPVTDNSGILIGIVTHDDVINVAQEEATEDFQKFGAVEALDEPYAETPLLEMIKKRAGWLSVLFLGETATAAAMAFYEHAIAKAVVLTLFIPLIISSGGNSGSQASTLVIRALSLGEITLKEWWFVMKREIISGFLLGFILALLGFIKIYISEASTGAYGEHWALIGLTLGTTLIGVVMWGTVVGSMLPFILKRLGFDPATSSAPFVATLVDVTGLIIYFTFASLLLTGTLL
ncbi:MAG: magnesium transporter [Ignavibacteriales bacterium]|nr:Magnesium transporter MgtE [Ignavibacteriaceae bacterium]MCK6615880.1 magnesium transporter [Ignavibacteriaceae bacterium]QOJ27338.1 MAG: magnesium transporter [Ignavibacteriales bacterium]